MHDSAAAHGHVPSHDAYVRGTQRDSGSFGPTWSGVHQATGTKVVLERIPPRYVETQGFLSALAEHGHAYAEIRNHALPRLYDVVCLEGTYYLAFAPTPTLPISRSARHPLDTVGFRKFTTELLSGLEVLHDHSIVHGALSQATVGIGHDGSAALLDTPFYAALRSLSLQLPESAHQTVPLQPHTVQGDCESACHVLEDVASHSALPAALIRTLTADLHNLLALQQSAAAQDIRGTILEDIDEYLEQDHRPAVPSALTPMNDTPPPEPQAPASKHGHPVRTALAGLAIAIALIALFGALWPLVLRPALNSGKLALASPVHVTVQPGAGHCSATFTATGTGTTRGTGSLTYHWIDTLNTTPQESTSSPDLHLHIAPQDRSFKVLHSWTVTTKTSLTGSIALAITAPAKRTVSVPVHLTCPS